MQLESQGTNYNSGTHQREPIWNVVGSKANAGSNAGSGSSSGEAIIAVVLVALLCAAVVIVVLACIGLYKGGKKLWAYNKRLREQKRLSAEPPTLEMPIIRPVSAVPNIERAASFVAAARRS